MSYITSRGKWYYSSWKADVTKSGGIATNIGVHFFDMLTWIFGNVKNNIVHIHEHDRAAGLLQLEKANVRWFLSISYDTIPDKIKQKGMRTFRSITIDGNEFEFSSGFDELHTKSYENIISGNGFRISEAENAIKLVDNIRNQDSIGLTGSYHPLARINTTKTN